ncbi:MAG: carbohydrate ABC transporter permease [Firmicutes bacterium]|jgi:ABC transporter, permease protein|nr:carbohydrate ABC transporter permease [Bacillota bacterium]
MDKALRKSGVKLGLKKRGKKEKIVFIFAFTVFAVYAGTYLFTFGWAFVVSLREKLEFLHNPFALPTILHFENYIDAFKALKVGETNLLLMFVNTVWYAGGATAIGVMASNILAYAVAKYKTTFTKFYYTLTIFIMLIPIIGALPQQYILYDNLGLINSPMFLITYVGGTAYQFILFHGFYGGVSNEYAEAAKVDGAGHYTIMLKIMLPMSLPMSLAIGIITFIGYWNDYMTVLLFLPDFPTLATGLYLFQSQPEIRSHYPLYYAAIIMSTVPIVVLYASFQNMIMVNTVAGGIKG